MKLWPFAKKTEALPAAQPIHPQSRKMELPPGVMLADPSELDFQPGQTRPAGETAPTESAISEHTDAPPAMPSFEDLAYIPNQEATEAQTGTSSSQPDEPDLADAFGQISLTSGPQGAPTNSVLPLPLSEPGNLAPPPFMDLSIPSSETHAMPEIPTPWHPDGNTNELANRPAISEETVQAFTWETEAISAGNQTETAVFDFSPPDLQANPASQVDFPANSELDFFTPAELTEPVDAANTTAIEPSADLFPLPAEGSTAPATDQWLPNPDVLPDAPPSFFPDDHACNAATFGQNVETPEMPTDTGNLNQDSFFMYPTGQDLMFPQQGDMFDASFETQPASLESPLPALQPSEYTAPQPEQPFYGFEAAFPDAEHSLPPQLNLPDEALSPNSSDSFFEAAAFQPMPEAPCATEPFENDSFDLDSLLLGHSHSEGNLAVENSTFPALALPDEALPPIPPSSEPFNASSFDDSLFKTTDEEDSGHYFGDEAEGLKGIDNIDSYDLGHYEDPDEPAIPFMLDEVPTTESGTGSSLLAEEYSYPANPAEYESHTSFEALQYQNDSEPAFDLPVESEDASLKPDEANNYTVMASLPSKSQFLEGLYHPVTPDHQISSTSGEIPEAMERLPETVESIPEPKADTLPQPQLVTSPEERKPAEAPQAIPPIPPNLLVSAKPARTNRTPIKPLFHPKPYQDSLADRIGTFEQEVLLKNSQFLSQSIDHLVNAYFEQQAREEAS